MPPPPDPLVPELLGMVMVTGEDCKVLPLLSVAVAVSVWTPAATPLVFQLTL